MALRTILIPYDGSAQADDLLRLACEEVGGDGRVVALYVTRVPPSLPLDPLPARVDAAGNDALDHAERVTRPYDGVVETRLTRARHVADAIVGEARETGADAIYMPLGQGSIWRRWRRARAAWRIARRAPCRVLLCYVPALDDLDAATAPHTGSGQGREHEWPAPPRLRT